MCLEHHLVGGYVRYISPHIIIMGTLLLFDSYVHFKSSSSPIVHIRANFTRF